MVSVLTIFGSVRFGLSNILPDNHLSKETHAQHHSNFLNEPHFRQRQERNQDALNDNLSDIFGHNAPLWFEKVL